MLEGEQFDLNFGTSATLLLETYEDCFINDRSGIATKSDWRLSEEILGRHSSIRGVPRESKAQATLWYVQTASHMYLDLA